jgi:thymidine phosphorylase
MSQPLGTAIGNALDIAETVRVLKGEARGRLGELAVRFAVEALRTLEPSEAAGAEARVEEALASGAAAERFGRMVLAQGGDPRVVDDPWSVLPRAPVRRDIAVPASGSLTAVDAEALGRAAMALGAGRIKKGDAVDPAVGIEFLPKVGDALEKGASVGTVHARDDAAARAAADQALAAVTISDQPGTPPPLVFRWFGTTG